MKVAIHNGARELRGSERQTLLIAAELMRRGHEVVVSCVPNGPLAAALRERGVRTSAARPRGDLDPWSFARFTAWLRRERPDVLLLATWKRVPLAAAAARVAGVPRVVVRLGITRAMPRARRFRAAFRYGVDALVVNSPDVRDRWLASAPWFPAETVVVALNAVEPLLPSAPRDALRASLGVGREDRLVVSAGGLERRKGFDLLLDAFALLDDPRARLVVAGDGPDRDALRARAAALGVRALFPGPRRDVADLFAAAELFVMPSRADSLANAMLEAMAQGVPVVATATGGVPLALGARDGGPAAGWIVPVNDAPALAAALREVLSAPRAEVALRTGEARRRIREWFSVERMVDTVEAALAGGSTNGAETG
jgi:glycosyltransferase involved in cell wall biosynthesis